MDGAAVALRARSVPPTSTTKQTEDASGSQSFLQNLTHTTRKGAQTKENTAGSHTSPTLSGNRVSQGLGGVRRAANERRQEKFTALLHHLSVDLLRESFYALQRKAAPGVDGGTWREYETGLEGRLVDLDSRVHRGAYRAQPSRRVYIQKSDGRQRRLGIAALEDKTAQQAVVTIFTRISTLVSVLLTIGWPRTPLFMLVGKHSRR